MNELRIGFLVNPVAGAGGQAALKGSDAASTREAVYAGNLNSPSTARALQFLQHLQQAHSHIYFYSVHGAMGGDVLSQAGFSYERVECQINSQSGADDTKEICKAFAAIKVDVIVFVGGDGTARDVCDVLADKHLCLGVPSGVKMQSAVFGVHPAASAEIILALSRGAAVLSALREVRDIDEQALLRNEVSSRFYGELKVPVLDDFLQQVKQGGGEVEALVLDDIAEEVAERIEQQGADVCVIFGPGSTTKSIQETLGYSASLLGVDLVCDGESHTDLNEATLFERLSAVADKPKLLVLTIIGGQGHLIGRGNQQLSARVLQLIGRHNLCVVATPQKLRELEGRYAIIDSDDPSVNESWVGLIEVISGYNNVSLLALGDSPLGA